VDITSANSSVILTVPTVFALPQVLEGYATDDAWSADETEVGNTVIGVDGLLSSAWIPALFPMKLTFQADSSSVPDVMEAWRSAEAAAKARYVGSMVINLPAIGLAYYLKQIVLQRATPFAAAKKMGLQQLSYQLMFTYQYSALPTV
jgi:hypothetical protein